MALFIAGNTPRTPQHEIAEALKDPGFGRWFTDDMARADWNPEQGWHGFVLAPTGAIPMHPGLAALHYGQEIFEGLKAYRHPDSSVWLFRPRMNAARFARSATRMAMPPLPEEVFIDSVVELVAHNLAWVPEPTGEASMYLRPFMFGSETLIGVRAANAYTYIVLGMPVMPFYPDPLRLWITPNYSRSMAGGTGEAKCGGNYATALIAENQAHDMGCQQVLWLDSATRSLVEEGGTMNFFAVTADGELLTPALNGQILAGVTRDSLLALAPHHDLTPVERELTLDELLDGIASGRITETFACGTAAVISPVVGLRSPDIEITVGDGTPGATTRALREHLTGIQFGTRDDIFHWMHRVG